MQPSLFETNALTLNKNYNKVEKGIQEFQHKKGPAYESLRRRESTFDASHSFTTSERNMCKGIYCWASSLLSSYVIFRNIFSPTCGSTDFLPSLFSSRPVTPTVSHFLVSLQNNYFFCRCFSGIWPSHMEILCVHLHCSHSNVLLHHCSIVAEKWWRSHCLWMITEKSVCVCFCFVHGRVCWNRRKWARTSEWKSKRWIVGDGGARFCEICMQLNKIVRCIIKITEFAITPSHSLFKLACVALSCWIDCVRATVKPTKLKQICCCFSLLCRYLAGFFFWFSSFEISILF